MNLQEKIRCCEKCPLFKNMSITPIAPDWVGSPKVMFIIDSRLNQINDFEQSPITGVTKARFLTLVESKFSSYYITPFVKCIGAYPRSKATIDICKEWIEHEINTVNPKVIIGCGALIKNNISCNYYCQSPSKIIESLSNEKKFEKILTEARNITDGDKS